MDILLTISTDTDISDYETKVELSQEIVIQYFNIEY